MIQSGKNIVPVMKSIHLFAAIIFVLARPVFGSETVTVMDISGTKTTGTLKSWSKEKLSIATTPEREFPSDEIRSVSFDHPSQKVSRISPTLWLSNGDRISARAVSVANDKLTFSWPILEESASVPLEKVIAIIFEWPEDLSGRLRFIADFQTLPAGNDLVILTNGDRTLGSFERLDAAHLELKVGATVLKLDRSRARAIRFNPELTTIERQSDRRAVLTMTDGSHLTVTSIELLDDVLQVKSAVLGTLKLPLTSVAACHLFGDRLIPISDYEPSKIEFTPYLSTTWPLVRNANVRRGPLSLRRGRVRHRSWNAQPDEGDI